MLAAVPSSATGSEEAVEEAAGPAHVATVSFLASRAVPTGGFWVALAGGTALARVAQRRGAREGYGASWAAMLETVAIMGPARFGVPFTQALSAPLLGRLEARGTGPVGQVAACTAIRVLSNAVGVAFFVWVIAGGLDAYAGSYDAVAGRLGFTLGESGTLAITAAGLLGWGVFASVVQVGVYRRGLRGWPEAVEAPDPDAAHRSEPASHGGRFDPRAVALAAVVAFALLLASTSWPLLAAVAGWLALAWVASRGDRAAIPTGLALTGLLAGGALVFSLVGGLGLDTALRRANRAALLVLVATWLRSAAGAAGLREVFTRVLGRVAALPSAREASATLAAIATEGQLAAAGRSLLQGLSGVPNRPGPFVDAVLGWVVRESSRAAPAGPGPAPVLSVGPLDALLVALALAPVAALAA